MSINKIPESIKKSVISDYEPNGNGIVTQKQERFDKSLVFAKNDKHWLDYNNFCFSDSNKDLFYECICGTLTDLKYPYIA